jgi:hypothetical protein
MKVIGRFPNLGHEVGHGATRRKKGRAAPTADHGFTVDHHFFKVRRGPKP